MEIRKIYFMGIKGVGMASLAVMAKQAGFIVGGSDVEEEFITDKILKEAGIYISIGFKKENVDGFVSGLTSNEVLFIATGAHNGFDNAEVEYARMKNIKIISHGEAVGLFMSGNLFDRTGIEGISVAGAHGKTTISAMIASCLVRLGLDPSYAVGTSEINPIGAAGHYGLGAYFVAEADEYLAEAKYDRTPKFLYQHPKYLVINNIDFDHPDFYKNINEVEDAYEKFAASLNSDGLLIFNGDDKKVREIGGGIGVRTISYGTDDKNEFILKNFRQKGLVSQFEVLRNGTSLGVFDLSIPGYHNAKNALAAIALLMEIGISVSSIQKVLPEFLGSRRRFEKIGEMASGVQIFDDYAHHPEEIRKTLEAVRTVFPNKKITVVFQAHTYARTRSLLSEFVSSLAGVDELIILPTFASARSTLREPADRSGQVRIVDPENLDEDQAFVEKIRVIQPNVKLIETIPSVVEYVKKNILGSDKIIIAMGAGNVYKIAYRLAENS